MLTSIEARFITKQFHVYHLIFRIAMLDMTAKDREKAATWIIGNYEAQLNALLLLMLRYFCIG